MDSITDLEATEIEQFKETAVLRLEHHAALLNQRTAPVETTRIGRTVRRTNLATGGIWLGRAICVIAEIGAAFKQTSLHTQFEAIRRVQIG